MKRILTFILLFALITSMFAVGAAFAEEGENTTVLVSETERIKISYATGTTGGFFGTGAPVEMGKGDSITMQFTIKDAHIPVSNWNLFLTPTNNDIIEATSDWLGSNIGIYGNPYNTGMSYTALSKDALKENFGEDATLTGSFSPLDLLVVGKTLKIQYKIAGDTDDGHLIVWHKDEGADDSTYTEVMALKNMNYGSAITGDVHFVFWINGTANMINSEDPSIGKFHMEIADYKILDTNGEELDATGYLDTKTTQKDEFGNRIPTMQFEKYSAEEAATDKVLNIVSNAVNGEKGNIAYYYKHSALKADAVVKFSTVNSDAGLKLVLDKDMDGVDGTETYISVPSENNGAYELSFDGANAILKNGAGEVISETAYAEEEFYFGFYLENEAPVAKNVYVDDLAITMTDYKYGYGFNNGTPTHFDSKASGKGNFAFVQDTAYTVNYFGVDGEILSAQQVGYANDADIPVVEGRTIANLDQVIAQSTFIDGNRTIYVEFEDDDLNYIVVFVDGGTLDDGTTSRIIRPGDEVVATLDTIPVGRIFTGWMIGGEKVSDETVTTYTFNPTESTSLVANLIKTKHTITVEGGQVISINDQPASGTEVVAEYGDMIKLQANDLDPILNPGTTYAGWFLNDVKMTSSNQIWFTLTEDVHYVALTEKESISVVIGNGHWNGLSSFTVAYGTEIVAIPNAPKTGYVFSHWIMNNEVVAKEDTLGDSSLIFEATINNTNVSAVFAPIEYKITIIGGKVDGEVYTDKAVAYGTELYVSADAKAGYTFAGWYVGDELVSTESEYDYTVEGDAVLTAKYTEGVQSAGGCACGTIGSNGDNGGMFLLVAIMAVIVAGIALVRSGKMKTFVKSALVLVLCVAVVGGAILTTGSALSDGGDKVLSADGFVAGAADATGEQIVEIESASQTILLPSVDFDLTDKVLVTLDIMVDKGSDAATLVNNYSTISLYTTGDKFITDSLPAGEYVSIIFESQIVMKNGAFAAELIVKDGMGAIVNIKNVEIKEDTLSDELLGGATMWMLPSATTAQNMSFVVKTADGQVIVVDGGNKTDATFLVNFLYTMKAEVDHWFITHYHEDHIGAISEILKNDSIAINNLYFRFPEVEEIATYGEAGVTTTAGNEYDVFMNNYTKAKNVVMTYAGQVIEIGDVTMKVLNDNQIFPVIGEENTAYNYGNNTGIVFRMDTAGESVLFLGDAGEELGDYLLANCAADLEGIEIVQAAHHGQNGVKESFYQAVGGTVYLVNAPDWLWYNEVTGKGINSGTWNTLINRGWFREIGVARYYVAKDGLQTIK